MKLDQTAFTLARLAAPFILLAAGIACAPPPEDDSDTELPPIDQPLPPPIAPIDDGVVIPPGEVAGPGDETEVVVQAPGGAFVDTQCQGKHRRHAIASFTHRGARYIRSGNVETFDHLDTSCNRVEIDTNDHYKGGTHTFSGDVRIDRVTGQSVVQIFDATDSGPIMMIKAFNSGGGTLRKYGGGVELIDGATGKWVNVRIVHDLGANTLSIYINGQRKWSGGGGRGGGFNLKYGNYGTGAPTRVQWRNASW